MTPGSPAADEADSGPREKEPRKKSAFADDVFIFDQKIGEKQWRLGYRYRDCNGCGICVEICPTGCMELGNVPEISSGLDAPPVMIDVDGCCFCGMCAGLCPLHAFDFSVDEEDIRELDGRYPYLSGNVDVNEKCLPCLICAEGCPTESIKLELEMPSKEELVPYDENKEGSIEIDFDKCTMCGLCVRFCEALALLEKEPKGPDQMPFESLLVDEGRCDYCGLCVSLCPDDAITVEGERVDKDVKWSGEITVDHQTCIRCGRCKEICPYDAIYVEKFLEGRIDVIQHLLVKCDPTGCVACFNACPTDAWYVPDEGVIAVNEDVCNYCGGCQEACRHYIIDVHREVVRTTPLEDASWREQWVRALDAITGGDRGLPAPPRVHMAPAEEAIVLEEKMPEIPSVIKDVKSLVDRNLEKIRKMLGNTKVRYLIESDGDKAENEIERRFKEGDGD